MKGIILSYFPQGHGFVKSLLDRRQYFYHTSNSPDLDEITHIGMFVEFEVAPSAKRTWGEEAINLTRVEE
jgi:hypothetical protein